MNDATAPRKATHEQLRRHNRRLLLRAIYLGRADSRAALAGVTGLTKPTVSNLIAELIDEGLVGEGGHGPSGGTGGKRPRLVAFRPRARQAIGVAVDGGGVHAVLTDLAGATAAQHRAPIDPERPLEAIVGAVDGLRAQLDAPLLGIGVGVPGEVDGATGVVRHADGLGWRDVALTAPLRDRHDVPVHLAQGTELCALAQYAFGNGRSSGPQRLATLQVGPGVEFGVTLEGGSVHYGGDLSRMTDPVALEIVAGWDPVVLRHDAVRGDAAARRRIAELGERLAPLVAWLVVLLRPDQLTLAGGVVELGEPFLERLREAVAPRLDAEALRETTFSRAYAPRLSALGAIALTLQQELGVV